MERSGKEQQNIDGRFFVTTDYFVLLKIPIFELFHR